MIPINDENPTSTTPIVVYALIALNVVVFLHQMTLGRGMDGFFQLYAVIPQQLSDSFAGVSSNQPVPEILTLITSQFLHGGLMHIGGNMLFLWTFGDNIEHDLGHFKFLFFYLACGVLAGLAHWFFGMQSGVPTVGASGANRRGNGGIFGQISQSQDRYYPAFIYNFYYSTHSCDLFSRLLVCSASI